MTRTPTGRPLRGLLTAEAVSITGTRVSMIALPWFVLSTTGSATQTGLVAAVEIAPLVVVRALGGPLIDRVGPRRVSVGCDLLSVVAVGLIPLLHLAGLLTMPVLLLLVALGGALRGPGDAAKSSLVPAVSAHAGVSLERTTGLSSSIERTASMLGAALAGGLVALAGATSALVLDAASFGVSALVLGWATRSLPTPAPAQSTDPVDDSADLPDDDSANQPSQSYWARLRSGWLFLRGESVLMALTLMVATTNLLDLAYSAVLLPVWAKDSGHGAGVVGLVFAVFSGASILGSLAAATWAERLPRFRLYVVAFLLAGLPRFVVLALGYPVWVVLAVGVVGGFAAGFLNPILGAVFFERIPAPLIGRVNSLSSAMGWGLMPLGGVAGGLLATGLGVEPALLVVGALYFATTMAPVALPAFREMDRRSTTAADGRTGADDDRRAATTSGP